MAIPRIRKLLAKYDLPASFFVPAVVAKIHPDEQRGLADEGHEIGIHGWIHELNSKLPAADERDLMMRAADELENICGKRPVGMRTPSWDFSAQLVYRGYSYVYGSRVNQGMKLRWRTRKRNQRDWGQVAWWPNFPIAG